MIGLQWGDEAKGKLVDLLTSRFDIVVRYQGGANAGHTVVVGGRRCIIINGNDRPERQRFTACHEIAHIVLELPTEHANGGSQFARRSPNEVLCDVFAAELLLPCHLVQPLVEESAAAAESLKGQARNLVDAVAVFRLGTQAA